MKMLAMAAALKKYGAEKGVPELTQAEIPLGEVQGHLLSMVACGACKAKAYYRGPYAGGAVFLLITDPDFPTWTGNALARILFTFPQVFSTFPARHRRAFSAYVRYYGLKEMQQGGRVEVGNAQGQALYAAFDAQERLTELKGTVAPESHAAGASAGAGGTPGGKAGSPRRRFRS